MLNMLLLKRFLVPKMKKMKFTIKNCKTFKIHVTKLLQKCMLQISGIHIK